jgi:hypothetical protein
MFRASWRASVAHLTAHAQCDSATGGPGRRGCDIGCTCHQRHTGLPARLCRVQPPTAAPRLSTSVAGAGRPCRVPLSPQPVDTTALHHKPSGWHGFCLYLTQKQPATRGGGADGESIQVSHAQGGTSMTPSDIIRAWPTTGRACPPPSGRSCRPIPLVPSSCRSRRYTRRSPPTTASASSRACAPAPRPRTAHSYYQFAAAAGRTTCHSRERLHSATSPPVPSGGAAIAHRVVA